MSRVAYQGAPGAYSEESAAALFPQATLVPLRTFAEVFAELEEDRVDAAVLPVENSIVGSVVDVYDLLRQHSTLAVRAEAILRIRHCLLGVPGAKLREVKVARSHPQALAQCEAFLRKHGIEAREAFDTAGAAREVKALGDPRIAAVASRRAGDWLGLSILAEGIETVPENYTRFFALSRRDDGFPAQEIPAEHLAGEPKTSLVFAVKDAPGALVRALQPFATAGVNLTKIESRPSRAAPWDYVFYLDLNGDPETPPTLEAIALLRLTTAWVHILGTYPMANGTI